MITVQNLTKQYQVSKRKPGVMGAVMNLFHRQYDIKTAVNGVSFSINQGEMVGYIGANGAGKSTTIKMLCGILAPTSGTIEIAGVIPYRERQKNARNIGAVFGQRTQLFWDIPVRESFNLLRHIYSIPQDTFTENMHKFCDILSLGPLLDRPVRQMSLGEKMRCELAAAFLHNPRVVFLDEPTIGLDVAVKSRIREFIKEMNRQRGTTVILTTHDMQDIEEICTRVIMIDSGQILYDGDLPSVKQRFGYQRSIQFEIADASNFQLPSFLHPSVLADMDDDGRIQVVFDARETNAAEIIQAIMASHTVQDLTIREPSIESIVKQIYERGIRNA